MSTVHLCFYRQPFTFILYSSQKTKTLCMLAQTFVFVFETVMYSTDALVTWLWPDLWLSHVVVSGRRSSSWDSKVTLSWWTTCSRPKGNITSDYCGLNKRCTSGMHYTICFVVIVHNKIKVLLGASKGCNGAYTPNFECIGQNEIFPYNTNNRAEGSN